MIVSMRRLEAWSLRKTRSGLKREWKTQKQQFYRTFRGYSFSPGQNSCFLPNSRRGAATGQILHDASEELFAEFGPFSVTHGQHGLEHCAGGSIRHAH